jgi:integrase/recombinase XerD
MPTWPPGRSGPGVEEWRQLTGPLLATATGGRLRQGHLWELVRRLACTARVGGWEQLSPDCLRHSAITFDLDAGAPLRHVQDYAGHKDPPTTRRYDHSRDSLDRNAAYTGCCLSGVIRATTERPAAIAG